MAAAQAEEIKKLRDELNLMKTQVGRQTGTAAASSSSSSNIGIKTTIRVPEMLPKMSFSDYKFEVDTWLGYAKAHMDSTDLAWLLLNHMPANDERMIKRTIIEKLGMDKIRSPDGVKLLLEEMDGIVKCEPFTRLVEWLQSWETLSQGSQ